MVAPRQAGFVYILTNPAYTGLIKIGHTARDPWTRADELSTTGVPMRFEVAWYHRVTDHEALEGIVHGRLARCRANDNREFFRCKVSYARKVIETEAAALLLPWWRVWLRGLVYPSLRRPSRRSTAGRGRAARRPYGDTLIILGTSVFVTVLYLRPEWVPPAIFHLLTQLPHLGVSRSWPF